MNKVAMGKRRRITLCAGVGSASSEQNSAQETPIPLAKGKQAIKNEPKIRPTTQH